MHGKQVCVLWDVQSEWRHCVDCNRRDDPLLSICLHCVYFGCVCDREHLQAHMREKEHKFGTRLGMHAYS